LRLSTISLGAKKHHSILYVLLPEIKGGILHGTILALARAVEDTAVIMLTGVAAFSGYPTSLLSSFEALPFFIYYKTAEYSNQQELDQVLMAIIILVIINISLIFLADIIFKNKKERNG
jgi:phosphate transport system permease protein